MTQQGAERAIITSALIVGGVYAYRRFSGEVPTDDKHVKHALGLGGALLSTSKFVTGWGFAFLVCAIVAEMNPGLGGGFAMLIGTADFLTNMPAIKKDVDKGLTSKTAYAHSSFKGPSFGNPGQSPQANANAIVNAVNQAPGASPVHGATGAITPSPPTNLPANSNILGTTGTGPNFGL